MVIKYYVQFYRLISDLICQGVDLRQYSRQIEGDLHEVENASILDCILPYLLLRLSMTM